MTRHAAGVRVLLPLAGAADSARGLHAPLTFGEVEQVRRAFGVPSQKVAPGAVGALRQWRRPVRR